MYTEAKTAQCLLRLFLSTRYGMIPTPGEALRAAVMSSGPDPQTWDFDELAAVAIEASDAVQDHADRRFEDDGGAWHSELELELERVTRRLERLEKALECLAPQDRASVLRQLERDPV